jgi:AbrB family looped-hinge helix DNA binding protein
MRVTTKGQVTIPQNIRQKAGIQPGTEVEFKQEKGRIYLTKKKGAGDGRSRFARVRGSASLKMNTDEIMALTREK